MNSQNDWETQPRKKNGEFTFRQKCNIWKEIVEDIEKLSDKDKINHSARGGSYGELRKETAGRKNIEVHHMPSNSASMLSRRKGPCIVLTQEEHYKTASHSRVKGSGPYRLEQKKFIQRGHFLDAEIMDIIDILFLTREKYVKALSQKLDYDLKLYEKGEIDG